MSSIRSIGAIAAAVMSMSAGAARAGIYGAHSNASTGDIYPNGGITNGSFSFNGGENFAASLSDVDDSVDLDWDGTGPWNRGRARSFASISGSNVPATLKSECRLTGSCSTILFNDQLPVSASAFSLAGTLEPFQYLGNIPMTLSLTYSLDVEVATDTGDFWGSTGAYASFSVWDDQISFFATDVGSLSESGAQLLSHNSNDAVAYITVTGNTQGTITESATIKFDVVPGQVFYVQARLGTAALYGTSFADGFNTLTGAFSDSSVVQSLVPAPGAATLILCAGAALSRRRR